MQAARCYSQQDIRVEDVEPDEVGPEEVRVEVDSCGICGSDLHEYVAEGSIFEEALSTNPNNVVLAERTISGSVRSRGTDPSPVCRSETGRPVESGFSQRYLVASRQIRRSLTFPHEKHFRTYHF